MAFDPAPNLRSLVDRLVQQRMGVFRDALSVRSTAVREDMARRGVAGPAVPWKVWAAELDTLPQLMEEEAFGLLEDSGVAPGPSACDWLTTMLDGHLEALTRGLSLEAEATFPGAGFTRLLTEFMQRLRARVRADLRDRAAREALRGTGRVDPGLSMLLHRGAFDEDLLTAAARAGKAGKELTLLFFDLDHFKALNDGHGHRAGDDALGTFAERLKTALADRGVAYRYGGDEFAVIVPDCGREGGVALAARLREEVMREPLTPHSIPLDVSVGVSTYPTDGTTAEGIIKKADDAMYVHKQSRRPKD